MTTIVAWIALICGLVALFYEHGVRSTRLEDLPEEERVVVAAAKQALGESQVRLKDRRLLVLFLAVMAFGFIGGLWLTAHDNAGKRVLARQQGQLTGQQATLTQQQAELKRQQNDLIRQQRASDAKARKNCLNLNGTIVKIDKYLDAQAFTTSHRADLDAPTKAQLLKNLTIFRPAQQDCT